MAARGRTMVFHGAYASKREAKKKERAVHGFIRKTEYPSGMRYLVLTERARNPRERARPSRLLPMAVIGGLAYLALKGRGSSAPPSA